MIDWSKNFEDLTFRDDFMFGKTMEDKELCRDVLECLLQRPVGELEDITPQREFRYTKDGKPIRLDIYTGDEVTVYDAEMQNLNNKTIKSLALPKRMRFYQASIDTDHLQKNQFYKSLPDSIILFICTFDPLGLGLSTYTFRECCKEADGVELGDGTTKILFNCTYKGKDIPENLRSLYNYVESGIITDDLTHRIDTAVQTGRYREQWRSEYMKERAMIMDILEETEQAKAETEQARKETEQAKQETKQAKQETKQAKQETEAANRRADSEAQRADSAEKDNKIFIKWFLDNNIPIPNGINII